jgi:hypothetical protein
VNYQVSTGNLVVSGAVALIYGVLVTFLASWVLGMIGFVSFFGFIAAFLLGPAAGDVLVRISDRLTHNKKGRSMQLSVTGGYVLGALPWTLLIALLGGLPLSLVLFTIMAATTAVARVR